MSAAASAADEEAEEEREEEELTAVDGDVPSVDGGGVRQVAMAVAMAEAMAVAVGAQSETVKSTIPLAAIDPPALGMPAGVAVSALPIAATIAAAVASASAFAVEVGGALELCAAVALIWSEWPGVGLRWPSRATSAVHSGSRSLNVAIALGVALVACAGVPLIWWAGAEGRRSATPSASLIVVAASGLGRAAVNAAGSRSTRSAGNARVMRWLRGCACG